MSDPPVSDSLTPDVTGGGSEFSSVSSAGGPSQPVAVDLHDDDGDDLGDNLAETQPMDLAEVFRAPEHQAIYPPKLARSTAPAGASPAATTHHLL